VNIRDRSIFVLVSRVLMSDASTAESSQLL